MSRVQELIFAEDGRIFTRTERHERKHDIYNYYVENSKLHILYKETVGDIVEHMTACSCEKLIVVSVFDKEHEITSLKSLRYNLKSYTENKVDGRVSMLKCNKNIVAAWIDKTIDIFDLKTLQLKKVVKMSVKPDPTISMKVALSSCKSGKSLLVMPLEDDTKLGKQNLANNDLVELNIGEPYAALAMNEACTKLAVASFDGTEIKLMTIDGELFQKLHRGLQPVTICSLKFNSSQDILSLTSSSATIHLFETHEPSEPILSRAYNALTSMMTPAGTKRQSFVTYEAPSPNVKTIVHVKIKENNKLKICLANMVGILRTMVFDPQTKKTFKRKTLKF